MAQHATLITPQGKKIALSPKIYREIKRLLVNSAQPYRQAKITKTIAATYGKYAGGRSLTQALLAERATERTRESQKLGRVHG